MPQVPARYNQTHRDKTGNKDDPNNAGSNQNNQPAPQQTTSILHSRSHQSLSAHPSRNNPSERTRVTIHCSTDDSELISSSTSQNSHVANRFSRHTFEKSPNGPEQPRDSLRHKSIPEIDASSNLLKIPNYMLPAKSRPQESLNPKSIPIISPDSNLIKPTAASKNKTQISELDNSGLGEAWGRMKLTPGQALQPNVPPPPPIVNREKANNPPKVAAQLEMSKFQQPSRLNTLSVADIAAMRKRHHLMSPKKQTLVLGLPGAKLRDPCKSYSVIEGSLVRNNQTLFIGNEFTATIHNPAYQNQRHHHNQESEQSLLQRLSEAPKSTTKKTLPVKIMYPKYRVPTRELFGLNEKPVYFLAPVKSHFPFES